MGRIIEKNLNALRNKYGKEGALQLIEYKKTLCLRCGYYYKRILETSMICPNCGKSYPKVTKLDYFSIRPEHETPVRTE